MRWSGKPTTTSAGASGQRAYSEKRPSGCHHRTPGRTDAFRVAEVRPQVSGIILRRNFTEGSDVKAGESLYQIDPATYQGRV